MDYLIEGFIEALKLLVKFDPETYSAVLVSLTASSISLFTSLLVGVPLGFIIGFNNFKFKRIIKNFLNSMMAVPTVVIGLFVYILISQRGVFGGMNLLFTIKGIAIGQFFLAIPIVVALTASAVESVDNQLKDELRSLGATGMQMVFTYIYECKFPIFAVATTAFGRVFSEVGISMMVGGNIKWHTRTITTAIALETGKGEFATGIALGIVLLVIAILVNFTSMYFTEKI